MPRTLCLHMPYLAIDRRRSGAGRSASGATVIAAPGVGGLRVVHADYAARCGGVRDGQTVAEANALVPGLVVHDADEAGDRAALETLAAWADCLSPVVQLEGADSLFVDVTGCERLFGGEDRLIGRAVAGVRARGFAVRAAIADTPGAAWALAQAAESEAVVSEAGRVSVDLARLPVWALRVDAGAAAMLRAVGVDTVEALLHLPRASIAARFGDGLLHRLDQALGDAPELLTAYRPPPVAHAYARFHSATDRLDLLQEGVEHALAGFCEQLARQTRGTRHLYVTFHFAEAEPQVIAVSLSHPTRDEKHLRGLLRTRLGDLRFADRVEAVVIWTREVEVLDGVQTEWLDVGCGDEREVADLVDRLAVQLGVGAVLRPVVVDEHQPERACGFERWEGESKVESRRSKVKRGESKVESRKSKVKRGRANGAAVGWVERGETHLLFPGVSKSDGSSLAGEFADASCDCNHGLAVPDRATRGFSTLDFRASASSPLRPLRMLEPAERVMVTAVIPDGPPGQFRYRGAVQRVVECVGPERIETGWWRGPPVRRDYYCVESDTGCRYWLFRERETGNWFLHGFFD